MRIIEFISYALVHVFYSLLFSRYLTRLMEFILSFGRPVLFS